MATNDTHYLTRDHAVPHDLLLCVQTKSDYDDPGRWRFTGEEFYLKSRDEMLKLFGEIPEALDNTLEIAEKVDLEFDFSQKHFPEFPCRKMWSQTVFTLRNYAGKDYRNDIL